MVGLAFRCGFAPLSVSRSRWSNPHSREREFNHIVYQSLAAACSAERSRTEADGVLNHEWHIDAASTEELERALQRLDARKYTMVSIQWDKQ